MAFACLPERRFDCASDRRVRKEKCPLIQSAVSYWISVTEIRVSAYGAIERGRNRKKKEEKGTGHGFEEQLDVSVHAHGGRP